MENLNSLALAKKRVLSLGKGKKLGSLFDGFSFLSFFKMSTNIFNPLIYLCQKRGLPWAGGPTGWSIIPYFKKL